MSIGTSVPCIQGSISSSGAPRGCDSSPPMSGDGHRPAYPSQDLHSGVGVLPGLVPANCFPGGVPSQDLPSSRRVSFAEEVTVLGDASPPSCSPVGGSAVTEDDVVAEDDMVTTTGESVSGPDTPPPIIPPPPGFSTFSWPYDDWSVNNGQSLFTFTKNLSGGVPDIPVGRPVVVPSLPLSPIAPDSADDSVTANMDSFRDVLIVPSEVGAMVPPLGMFVRVQRQMSYGRSQHCLPWKACYKICCGHQLLLGLRT